MKLINTYPLHRLAIADDRNAWFEAIRDLSDPLLKDRRKTSPPLKPTDFLSAFPSQQYQDEIRKKRLYATKLKIQKCIEEERENFQNTAKKEQFIKSLWGS